MIRLSHQVPAGSLLSVSVAQIAPGWKKLRRVAWCVTGCVLLVHAALVYRHFPLHRLPPGEVFSSGDLSFYLASALEMAPIVEQEQRTWGYSAAYMAGYPCGVWNSMGRRAYELGAVLPLADPQYGFLFVVMAMTLVTPLMPPLAMRLAGMHSLLIHVCFWLSALVYQAGDTITYFWTFGNVAFPFAAACLVLQLVLLDRLLRLPRIGIALAAGVLLGFLFWLHPIALLPLAPGAVVLGIVHRRQLLDMRTKALLLSGGALLVALLMALPWLMPLARFAGDRSPMALSPLPSGLKHAVKDFLTDRGHQRPFDRRQMFHGVIAGAAPGAWFTRGRGSKSPVGWLAAVAALTLAGSYLLPYLPFGSQLQPYRFVVSALMLAMIPAAVGSAHFGLWVRHLDRRGKLVAGTFGLLLLPGLIGYGFDVAHRSSATTLDDDERRCIAWLKQQPSDAGRVLCDATRLGSLIPPYAGQAVIGGGMAQHSFMRYGWTCIDHERAFGRPLEQLSADELSNYLSLYNVRWAVCESEAWSQRLGHLARRAKGKARFGRFTVFEIDPQPLDALWSGNYRGNVQPGVNRLTVRELPAGKSILAFHYLPTMRASDQVRIEPVTLLDDPVPFIALETDTPQDRVEITND